MSDTVLARLAGRTFWSEADARRVVAAWRSSGESPALFARKHGLDAARVRHWARDLEGGAVDGGSTTTTTAQALTAGFYEVVVRSDVERAVATKSGSVGLRFELPSGVVVDVGDARGPRLVEILRAVREVWGC